MQFKLPDSLIDDIIFAMENQGEEYLFDTLESLIVPGKLENDDERYVSLPEWGPPDGYRLMEEFAASCRNAEVKRKLLAALDRGRGVFRAFKECLAEFPETEQRWYAFKEREMRRAVREWYGDLRESRGLRRLGEEPEETADLVLEDFRFRQKGNEEAAAELHAWLSASEKTPVERNFLSGKGEILAAAETPAGELAGYGGYSREGETLRLFLEVAPEYRGIGLGEALLEKCLEALSPNEAVPGGRIILELPEEAEKFQSVLLRHSFRVFATVYVKE
jgi:GNAT superfamily N-acetyltransferase